MPLPLDILCIEDSPADYLLLERNLRKHSLVGLCERVDSVEQLDAALARHRWQLVISDYSVPGMYFADTLARIHAVRPGLPVILISGTIGSTKGAAMVRLGAWDHVHKDEPERLVEAVQKLAVAPAAGG